MGGKFSRSKGQRGERAVIAVLQPVVSKVYQAHGVHESDVPLLERNLMQANWGGHDIVGTGLDWLALEVKHQEVLSVGSWWEQAKLQAGNIREPVLIYRRNRVKWRVVMFTWMDVEDLMALPVVSDISLEDFLVYFEARLRAEVASELTTVLRDRMASVK